MEKLFFYLLILFLPTQLGKHFWPASSVVSGIRVDYLSPTVYFTDVLVLGLFVLWMVRTVQNAKFKVQSGSPKLKVAEIFSTIGRSAYGGNFKLQFLTFNFALLTGIVFFALFLVANVLMSSQPLNGFYSLLKFLEFSFVAFYVAQAVREKGQVVWIATLLAVGVIGESVLAIAQYVTQGSIGGLFYFLGERLFTAGTPGIANASLNGELVLRPYGTFSHPNVLAGYLVISLLLIVSSFDRKSSNAWLRSLFLATFVSGAAALFLTMSRVAIGVFVVSFAVVLIRKFYSSSERRESRSVSRSFFFTVLLLTSCFLLLILTTPLLARFSQTSLTEEAFVHRQQLMTSAATMIGEKPFLGVGLGNFLPTLATIQKPLSLGLYLQPVHNIFLLVAAELGVIGFIIFVWFLVKTFFNALSHPENRIFIPLLLAIIVLGFFDHYFLTLQQGQLLFAVVVGLCWGKTVES